MANDLRVRAVERGDTILIGGAAGNVGAYAVQMAVSSGITVVAVARQKDEDFLRKLGANVIAHSDGPDVVREVPQVDAASGDCVETAWQVDLCGVAAVLAGSERC